MSRQLPTCEARRCIMRMSKSSKVVATTCPPMRTTRLLSTCSTPVTSPERLITAAARKQRASYPLGASTSRE
eukprot:3469154-Pyramimonas_sp.AAC.3